MQIRISVVCLVIDGTDSYPFVSCALADSAHTRTFPVCVLLFWCVLVWMCQVMRALESTRKLCVCHNHGMHVFRMEQTTQHHCQIQKYQAFILRLFCGDSGWRAEVRWFSLVSQRCVSACSTCLRSTDSVGLQI